MNRFFLLLPLLTLLLNSCSSGTSQEGLSDNLSRDPLAAFSHFPDSLFNGLHFDQPFADACDDLQQNSFTCIDSSGAFRYYKQSDSTEVVLPYQQRLSGLKVILRSASYRNHQSRLLQAFALTSADKQATADFSIFSYDLATIDFKLTVFTQPGFIRLNFELEKSK